MTPWEQLVALATWRMPWPPSCLIMQSAASKRRRQGRDYDNGCVTLTSVNRQSPSREESGKVGEGKVCTSRVC